MKEFKIKLSSNVDELMAQFAAGSKELKEFAKNANAVENEVKKLEVLEEIAAYIDQIDKALGRVKRKYPNLFQEIFGNVNKQIKEALSPLNKMSKEMTNIFGKTRLQLDSLIKDSSGATVSEIKEIGKAFKLVAQAMGNTTIDFSFLDGNSRNETKIKKLVSAMKELEQCLQGCQ